MRGFGMRIRYEDMKGIEVKVDDNRLYEECITGGGYNRHKCDWIHWKWINRKQG
jgi:hypothetical protein